jgi:hypothetical protein
MTRARRSITVARARVGRIRIPSQPFPKRERDHRRGTRTLPTLRIRYIPTRAYSPAIRSYPQGSRKVLVPIWYRARRRHARTVARNWIERSRALHRDFVPAFLCRKTREALEPRSLLREAERGANTSLQDRVGVGAVGGRARELQRADEEPQEGGRFRAVHLLASP